MYDFFFWFSVGSLLVNVLLILVSVWLLAANKKEKERRNSQVKIWMQFSNGITQGLERIINDKWNDFYSSVQDVVNSVHSLHASSFALYQSLYEERTITEEEYRKEQSELRKLSRTSEQQKISEIPESDKTSDKKSKAKK